MRLMMIICELVRGLNAMMGGSRVADCFFVIFEIPDCIYTFAPISGAAHIFTLLMASYIE